jgi:phosphohistidine phosphatase
MKYLVVMRHAKSNWSGAELEDHARPLNARGEGDAPRMGALLKQQRLIPDRIVSSTALRARVTAEIVARCCGLENRLMLSERLYEATAEEWCGEIHQLPQEDATVLCVGHNPGIEDFLAATTGRHVSMPTASIARLSYDVRSWSEVSGIADAVLLNVWRPKELPGVGERPTHG